MVKCKVLVQNAMKNIYRRNKADYKYQELPSVAEMVVVESNQSWYRAKILAINGKQSANIHLIDEGLAQRNIPIKNIFKINSDLLHYPPLSSPGEFEHHITCLPKYINSKQHLNGHRERLQTYWKYYFKATITAVFGMFLLLLIFLVLIKFLGRKNDQSITCMELSMILPRKISSGYFPNLPEILNEVKNEDGTNMFSVESSNESKPQIDPTSIIQYIDVNKLQIVGHYYFTDCPLTKILQ